MLPRKPPTWVTLSRRRSYCDCSGKSKPDWLPPCLLHCHDGLQILKAPHSSRAGKLWTAPSTSWLSSSKGSGQKGEMLAVAKPTRVLPLPSTGAAFCLCSTSWWKALPQPNSCGLTCQRVLAAWWWLLVCMFSACRTCQECHLLYATREEM